VKRAAPRPNGPDSPAELCRRLLAIVEVAAPRLALENNDESYEFIHARLSDRCQELSRTGRGARAAISRELAAAIRAYPTTRSLAFAAPAEIAGLRDLLHRAIDDFEGRRRPPEHQGRRIVAVVAASAATALFAVDRFAWGGVVNGQVEAWIAQARRAASGVDDMARLLAFAIAIVAIGLIAMTGPPRR
jgi:hypothetical protein